MSSDTGSSHSTVLGPGRSWWLEPGLAQLAFGSRPGKRSGAHATGVSAHLAFLPPDAIEIDLSDPTQRMFGDYELLEQIGQGGMGVVYRARQCSLAREVALKLLAAGPWASPDFIQRFEREAQSAARMQHPNIVPIHEIGAHEEFNFFSMRLVTGGSLAQKIARHGPMPPRDAARLLRSVAEAVDYAHRLDVLHLDLKPGNVLLDENGEPQVADFGLAKRLDEALAADVNEVSGTPSYMAPEQAQVDAQRLSAATDIYGLGAILYECLTGKPPFAGGSAQETLRLVASAEPAPPSRANPAISADLEAICLRCLAKDPAHRYATARALADDLSRYLEGRETRARPLNVAQRSLRFAYREPKLVGLLALVLFSLAMGFAATALQWRRAERSAADARQLLWAGRHESALQLEHDGQGYEALQRLFANLQEQEGAGDRAAAALERRRIGLLESGGAALRDAIVVADANPLAVALSPDGRTLAVSFNDQDVRWYDTQDFSERGRLSLKGRPSSDGEPRALLRLRFLDATHVVVTGEWYQNQVSPDGANSWLLDLERKAVLEPPAAFHDFADAAFSDNGRFAVLRDREGRAQLWQVRPWRALSKPYAGEGSVIPWLVDPQGRYALSLSTEMSHLRMHAAGDFARARDVGLPHQSGMSAWAMSSDGQTLALGDFEGRVVLLDMVTLAARELPAGRGRQVAWLEFSADDAWLAAGNRDGSVQAFDRASGDSVSGEALKAGFPVQRVAIDRARGLLLAMGEGRSALWRLSLPGPRPAPAQRIGLSPAAHGMAARFPIDWSPATGLYASAGIDGQLRLWRLPAPVMLDARAAPQVAEQLSLAGNALVDVDWNLVRLRPLAGGKPGPWRALSQPPGFAELVDGGRKLAVTLGPRLQLLDAANLRALAATVDLPASPERFASDAAGTRIALLFGGSGVDGYEERLLLFDARNGKRLAGEASFPGPVRRLQFSADGTRLLVVGPADDATRVFKTASLDLLDDYPHDPYQPVVWADFEPDSTRVQMVARATDDRLGGNALLRWTPGSDPERPLALPNGTAPLGVLALGDGARFVVGAGASRFAGATLGDTLPLGDNEEATAVLALSPDHRLLAQALRREVRLYDVTTHAPLGMPLPVEGDALDLVARLAFSADGRTLVGRTLQGRWLRWPVGADARPSSELAAELAAVAPQREDQRVLQMPARAQRAAWRAHDRGAWPKPEARPAPGAQRVLADGHAIPARADGTSKELVDLGTSYDVAPDSVRNVLYNLRPTLRPLPVGVQRIAGQWFDIRGMAQVGLTNATGVQPLLCVPVPDAPLAALHTLMLFSMPHPAPTGTALGDITLHYRDGGSAVLPILAGRDVRGYAGDDRRVPLAFAGDIGLILLGLQDDIFSAPRLANPEPGRAVRCFDVSTRQLNFPLLLLAATVESPPAAAGRNHAAETPLYPAGTAQAAPIPGTHQGVSR